MGIHPAFDPCRRSDDSPALPPKHHRPRSLVWKNPYTASSIKPINRNPYTAKPIGRSFVWKNPCTASSQNKRPIGCSSKSNAAIECSSKTTGGEKGVDICSSKFTAPEEKRDYTAMDNNFSHLATLKGHQNPITGLALPSGGSADKLFSGDKNGSLCVWDCHNGQCIYSVDLGGPIGCIIGNRTWLFIGIPNAVKAWNSETKTGLITLLTAPNGQITIAGQVSALAEGTDDLVFAGTHNGHIFSWKYTADVLENNCLQPVTCVDNAHKLPIISLTVGNGRLYSGSVDKTIRIWEINLKIGTLHSCLRTITGHTEAVTSLICWGPYLLSSSLDRTIKVWDMTKTTDHLCECYTHTEEQGLRLLAGLNDYHLLCSRNDNSLQIYDLPSFEKRGTIFFEGEINAVHTSELGGLFFTGDESGHIKVWKWLTVDQKKLASTGGQVSENSSINN